MSNKKVEGDRGKTIIDEDVPVMLRKVDVPLFKACEANFSEVELVIKQELADEDNEKKGTEITQTPKAEKKPMVNQAPKKPIKEVKTKNAGKKKENRNGKGKMKKVIWIIDSGCSRHMTGDMALLSQFEEMTGPLVTFGHNKKGFTMGYSKIISGNIVIEDVALVAGLGVKLLSVSQFTERGFNVLFDKGECLIVSKKMGETSLKGARNRSLFVAYLDSINEDGICCFYTKEFEEQSKLWHKKLSHLNDKEINTLVKKELEKGIVQGFSTTRTPQQNGVVERKNRTLVEDARTMLQDAKLPTRSEFPKLYAVGELCKGLTTFLIDYI
ncbi:hypothetical protein AgCh_012701 [Apium graveolens]